MYRGLLCSILPVKPVRPVRCYSALFATLAALALFAATDATQAIQQIETGLARRVVIKGEPVHKWTIRERLEHYHVPGVSIAVETGGTLAWAKGYGMADEAEKREVTPETRFQAASISKPVAAMVALRLVELGKLSLDEDVNTKLHSWKVPPSDALGAERITLRKLLSHTAGLTVHGFGGYAQGIPVPTLPQLLDGKKPANSQAVRVDIKPGTQWRYSGGGYEVMQQLVEDVMGKPFAAVAQELVLGPLGMAHSTYQQPLPQALRGMAASAYGSSGAAIAGKWHIYPEQTAAGLWTTPADLLKVVMEIQNPGRVLTRKTVDELTPVLDHYGLGFQLSDTDHQKAFQHGGANEGFRCQLLGYREGGRGAVVMTNGDNGTQVAGEILSALSATYGWPDFKPTEKTVAPVSFDKISAYAGTYEAPGGFRIVITAQDGRLYAQPTGFIRTELLPQSENSFFDPDGGAPDVHFERGPDGTLKLSAGGMSAKRIP